MSSVNHFVHGVRSGMANLQLKPPEPFNFKDPDNWPRWKRRFEQYRSASGLAAAGASSQINTLLYCLGEEAEDVLASTGISAEARAVYANVVAKFDAYFKVRTNVILERAKFNKRNQLEGESSETYITVLYSLVESCNYGPLKDEMLRDRIVVGIRDQRLSEQLQVDSELTLEKAKKMVRQREAVREQKRELESSSNRKDDLSLEALKGSQQAVD